MEGLRPTQLVLSEVGSYGASPAISFLRIVNSLLRSNSIAVTGSSSFQFSITCGWTSPIVPTWFSWIKMVPTRPSRKLGLLVASGPMSTMLPPDEMTTVVHWVQDGSDKGAYEKQVRPILDRRCMTCHDGSNPHLPNLYGYDNLKKVTERDTGTDIFTLVRVSHIHLFGLTFIFFIMGTVFSHAFIRPVWFKCTLMGVPFLFIATDISSWYMVKIFHPFAWLTMSAGALMGLCFAFMWVVSVYQMWFSSTPSAVTLRTGSQSAQVG